MKNKKIKAFAIYCSKQKKILTLANNVLESDCTYCIYKGKEGLEQPPKNCDKWVEVEIKIIE